MSTTSQTEFNFQWANIPCELNDNTPDRIKELLDLTKLPASFFHSKLCLDVGCGSGRYTYAMQQLGAVVDSIDINEEAIVRCKTINPNARVFDLLKLEPNPVYDLVFCFGVIHHCANPRMAFSKLTSQVVKGGILFIMVYHQKTTPFYARIQDSWHKYTLKEKLDLCKFMVWRYGGTIYGWFDAFNPKFNWGFTENEVKNMFIEEGFENIKLVHTISRFNVNKSYNINMIGQKKSINKISGGG